MRSRASSRFATLAQAISSTSETAPSRISSDGRLVPATSSGRPRTPTPHFALNAGYSFASCRLMVFNSASACSIVAPGFSRPKTTPQCGARCAARRARRQHDRHEELILAKQPRAARQNAHDRARTLVEHDVAC